MKSAFGFGIATRARDGSVLDVYFSVLGLGKLEKNNAPDLAKLLKVDEIRSTKSELVSREIDLETAPVDAIDVYLRLHLLSHRIIKPHGASLEGIFGLLNNVVWTSQGPVAVPDFQQVKETYQAQGITFTVFSVDKFPRMIDYVIPEGVRIADGDRVRLGAHLASGTTVMHEGFVNFNAGTLGASMVEGRISAGVVVGEGSDIGGGASIMGTLSGGGKEVISIGKKTLLGANSGIGISLGDDCVVEAGIYVTAGSKVRLPDGKIVKARELSGVNGALFRRNSTDGALELFTKDWRLGRIK